MMKKIKRFKAFESNTERQMTPNEFAQKYNSPDEDIINDFIVYVNGKPVAGYEYLADAFEYVAENIVDLMSWEVSDFLESLEGYLSENRISMHELSFNQDIKDAQSVDGFEEELNRILKEFLNIEYPIDEEVTIRLVD